MAGNNEQTPLSSSGATRSFHCASCLGMFNLGAVSILSVAVVFLFIQLQVVTVRVAQTTHHIDQVLDKVTSEQQEQIETLNTKVEDEHDLTILHMAGTFVILTCLISIGHMTMHLRHMLEPSVQSKIVAILWMPPVYSITSFLSLVWPVVEPYLAIIKDVYEAYVIYQFLAFLISVLGRGDRNVVVQVLARHADHLPEPTRLLNRCYHPTPDESPTAKANAVLLECQILAMQFVFCRPITSIASFVCMTLLPSDDDDASSPGWSYFLSPLFYISMIQNISVFFAFCGLLKFYHLVRDDLAWCHPFPKFLTIKLVVFMTFWQGLAISIIVHLQESSDKDPHETAAALQNVLICLEMLFFGIAHWCVFPTEEWEEGYRPKEYAKPGIGLKDFVSDVSLIVKSSQASRASRRRNGSSHHALEEDEQAEDDDDLEADVGGPHLH